MSRERWRPKARNVVRRYPALIQRESELRSGKITPSYNGMPSGKTASRTTELLAIRELPEQDRIDLNAVRQALITLKRYKTANERYEIIKMVYWQKTHTIDGAALCVHVSSDTARLWDREFIGLVDAFRRRNI